MVAGADSKMDVQQRSSSRRVREELHGLAQYPNADREGHVAAAPGPWSGKRKLTDRTRHVIRFSLVEG